MIYISNKETAQEVYVPRNGWMPAIDANVVFSAVSTSELTKVDITVSEWEVRGSYLLLKVLLPAEIFPGEWVYRLGLEGEPIVSQGVLSITEDEEAVKQYNKVITYKQYGE